MATGWQARRWRKIYNGLPVPSLTDVDGDRRIKDLFTEEPNRVDINRGSKCTARTDQRMYLLMLYICMVVY